MEQSKKIFITNIIVFIIFATLTFFIGLHHEPWADEAQAWLIARDCTIPNMILHVLKYEGHPILWFGILRTLNMLHFPYKLLFIIPWIASCLGVYLLIFKSKLPAIIKYLFPFTYFIFYQSAVIARNHSLVFPALIGLAIFHKNRLQHPYWYSLLLILTASISAYSFIISFVLLCLFIFDIFKSRQYSIKNFLPPLVIVLYMIFTALYLIKPADYNFYPDLNLMRLNPLRVLYITTRGYFNTVPLSFVLLCQMITTLGLYIFCAKTFCKTKRELLFFIAINLTLALAITALVCKPWHVAYYIITLIFTCCTLAQYNTSTNYPFKTNKLFYAIITFIFIIHISWSYKCTWFDIKNNYSASKAVAEYIKENNLDLNDIAGIGYKTIAIQPYFNKNLYKNYGEQSFWHWNKHFYELQTNTKLENFPVVIIDTFDHKDFPRIIEKLQTTYNSYFFNGYLYAKGHPEETESYVILVKK